MKNKWKTLISLILVLLLLASCSTPAAEENSGTSQTAGSTAAATGVTGGATEPMHTMETLSEEDQARMMVEEALNNAVVGYAKGDHANAVTMDLSLPGEYAGNTLTWTSSDEAVITTAGTVTRPEESKEVTLTVSAAYGDVSESKDVTVMVLSPAADEEVQKLSVVDLASRNTDNENFSIEYSEDGSLVTGIHGSICNRKVSSAEDALAVIDSLRIILGIRDPKEDLTPAVANLSEFSSNYTFNQMWNGIPVYGYTITVSTNKAEEARIVHSDLLPAAALDDVSDANVTPEEAKSVVSEEYPDAYRISDPEKVVYALYPVETPVIAYLVDVEKEQFDSQPVTVVVSAEDGSIIDTIISSYDLLDLAEGTIADPYIGADELGVEYALPTSPYATSPFGPQLNLLFPLATVPTLSTKLCDPMRNISINTKLVPADLGVFPEFPIDVRFGKADATTVSAFVNTIMTYDWYKNNLGRNGIDGAGSAIKVFVHVLDGYDNAYWNGTSLNFLDNSPGSTLPHTTASGLDICAHEYTHGVVDHMTAFALKHTETAGWDAYMIHEAYADIFGWFVDSGNTTIGETYKVLRNLADPWSCNKPKEKGDKYWYTKYGTMKDNSTYAHTNSSVISHAAYLMSVGDPAAGIAPIPMDTLYKIWYDSLTKGFSATSTVWQIRRNVLATASETFELPKEQLRAMKTAFDKVGVYGPRGMLTLILEDFETGERVKGATVRIYDKDFLVSEFTPETGLFHNDLDEGDYTIKVEAADYVPFEGEFTATSVSTTELTIKMVRSGRGTASGTVTNAITGLPLELATVRIRSGWDNTEGEAIETQMTPEDGAYMFMVDAGHYTIEAAMEGFTPGYLNVTVSGTGETATQTISLSPVMAGTQYRVVLTWGKNPRDLDSHLNGVTALGNPFHVWWLNTYEAPDGDENKVYLDVDDTSSYGPETITFNFDIKATYDYYVHWWSGSGTWAKSGAKVDLYNGNSLIATYTAPNSSDSDNLWYVFRIENGVLKTINIVN